MQMDNIEDNRYYLLFHFGMLVCLLASVQCQTKHLSILSTLHKLSFFEGHYVLCLSPTVISDITPISFNVGRVQT